MASVLGVALPAGIEWGIRIRDAATGQVLDEHEPHAVLPAASVGKLLLLVEVAGGLDLAEPLTRTAEDAVADSGLWQHLAVDTLPAGDLAALVGAVSDNLATNVLLRRVGLAAVQATARRLGLRHTALHDRVRDHRTDADPPALSTATAAELADLLAGLPGDPAGERVLGWLALGADLSMVAAGLGLDPLAHVHADRGVLLRHKTGTDTGVRADAGLLGGLAYAVLARFDDSRRDEVLATMRAIGSAMQAVPARSKPSRA